MIYLVKKRRKRLKNKGEQYIPLVGENNSSRKNEYYYSNNYRQDSHSIQLNCIEMTSIGNDLYAPRIGDTIQYQTFDSSLEEKSVVVTNCDYKAISNAVEYGEFLHCPPYYDLSAGPRQILTYYVQMLTVRKIHEEKCKFDKRFKAPYYYGFTRTANPVVPDIAQDSSISYRVMGNGKRAFVNVLNLEENPWSCLNYKRESVAYTPRHGYEFVAGYVTTNPKNSLKMYTKWVYVPLQWVSLWRLIMSPPDSLSSVYNIIFEKMRTPKQNKDLMQHNKIKMSIYQKIALTMYPEINIDSDYESEDLIPLQKKIMWMWNDKITELHKLASQEIDSKVICEDDSLLS